MENEIVRIASTQGIWAVISIVLILYILRTQENRDKKQDSRENNYQNIITKLTERFNIIEGIKQDVEDIKSYLLKK
ncbi:MAG: BhlA/UviB family holin-like peptide [Solirubrobacterales bacterium]